MSHNNNTSYSSQYPMQKQLLRMFYQKAIFNICGWNPEKVLGNKFLCRLNSYYKLFWKIGVFEILKSNNRLLKIFTKILAEYLRKILFWVHLRAMKQIIIIIKTIILIVIINIIKWSHLNNVKQFAPAHQGEFLKPFKVWLLVLWNTKISEIVI